ncbi:hypothetical protein ACJIZ3_024711 [Penstemon smallii]|uniref:Uncharacterized protein n=1 Tax=Penstemon smallii TaxID=265156 RepID=A0ABD3TTJ6_9LAMI
MDFQILKRKELQALCKKHNIPANLSNLDMANKLTALFKIQETEKPWTQGRIKEQDENVTQTESNNVVSNRIKKVRFSPDHEVIEFTRILENKRRTRRNSLLSIDTNLSVENNRDVDATGRRAIKRGQKSDKTNGKLRLTGEILMNERKQGRKNVKGDDNKSLVVVDDDKSIHGRATRSGGHNLAEASIKEEKRGKKVVIDMHSLVSIENGDNRVVTRRSFRNKGVVDEGKLTVCLGVNVNDTCEGREEVSKEKKIAEEKVINKPQILGRRSKRKRNDNCGKSEEVMKEKEIAEDKVIVEPQIMVRRSKRKANNNCEERAEVMEDKKIAEGKLNIEPQILVRRSKRKANNHCEEREEVVKEKEISEEKVTVKPQISLRISKRKGNNNCEEREEVLEDKETAEDKVIVEPQILLRRSKRKVNTVDNSETLIGAVQKHETDGIRGLRKTRKSLAFKGLGVDAKNAENKVEPEGKLEAVFQNQKPVKMDLRRSRRKSVMPAHEMVNDGRYALGSSVLLEEIAKGVSEVDKKVPQLDGVLRRSRRNNMKHHVNENLDTDAAVGNLETTKLSSEPCLVKKEIPAVQRSTRTSKRNASVYISPKNSEELVGGAIIQLENDRLDSEKNASSRKDVLNYDSGPLAQSKIEASTRENAPPAYDMIKVSEGDKPSSILKEPSLLEASPQEVLLAIEESLSAQLSVTEVAESTRNAALSMNTSTKTINKDMSKTSSSKSIRNTQDSCIADGAGTADMKLINGTPLANSNENDISRILELGINSADCDKEISVRVVDKIHLSLEVVQDILEETICVTKNNEVPALVLSQIEDSSCHNIIDDNELPEGLNVSENAGIAKNSYSVDSLMISGQPDIKTDMKVTEDEAKKCALPRLDLVNLVGEVKGVSFQENLDHAEPLGINEIVFPIQCHPDDVDLLEASKKSSEKSNKTSALKAGEIGDSEPCEGDITSTDSKSPLEIKVPSSGELRKGLENGYIVQGDKSYVDEAVDMAESNEGGCLREHNGASFDDSGFSAQVRKTFGESTKDSDQQELFSESPGVNSSITFGCSESSDIKLRGLEAGHIADGDCVHMGVHPELDKIDEERVFGVSKFDSERFVDITPQDRDFSGECSTKDFDEQEMFHDSANCSEMKLRSGLEADDIDEDEKNYALTGVDPELAKSDDAECLHDQKGASHLEKEFTDADLCNGETHSGVTPQSGETFIGGYMSHASPAVSPTIKYSEGSVANVFDTCLTNEKEAGIADIIERTEAEAVQSKMPGDNMSMHKTFSDEELEIFNKAEESSYKITYEPEEQPKTPLFETIAIANTFQAKKSSSCGSKTAGNALSLFKASNSQGEIAPQAVEKSNTDENENIVKNSISTLANCGSSCKVKEDFVDAQTAVAAVSTDDAISNVGSERLSEQKLLDIEESENQCQKLLEGNITSNLREELSDEESGPWEENELRNSNGTPVRSIAPSGPSEASSNGTEISNLLTSFNRSVTHRGSCSFTEKKRHMIYGEIGSEYEKSVNESLLLINAHQAVSCSDSIVRNEVKKRSSCKVDETSGSERKSEKASCLEDIWTLKAKEVIQTKSSGQVDGERGRESETIIDQEASNTGSVVEKEESVCTMNAKGVVQTKSLEKTDEERGREYEKAINGSLVLTTFDQEVSDTCSIVGEEENGLQLLFATPTKIEVSCRVDEISSFERNSESISCMEDVPKMKEEVFIKTKCHEEVGEDGNEHKNSLSLENSVLPDREGTSDEDLNLVKYVDASPVLHVTKYDPIEASEEKCAEMTCEQMKGTKENILSLGHSFLDEKATDGDSESAEKMYRLASSPRNLDEGKQFFDTDLSEKLTYASGSYFKPEGEMAQNSEVTFGVSATDLLKFAIPEKNHCFTANCEDSNNVRELLIDALAVPLNPEVAKVGSIGREIDVLMMDKETLLGPLPEEETTERKYERDDGISYDDKGLVDADDKPRSSHEMNDELQTNTQAEVRSYFEADMLTSNVEKQSTLEETCVACQSTAEDESTILYAESDLFTSLERQLFRGEHDNNDNENSVAEPSNFDLQGDHEKDGTYAEDNTNDMLELHLQEKVESSSNGTLTVSNLQSECDEMLKESDVMDTIEEYIESESSLSLASLEKINSEDVHSSALKRFSTAKKNARTILIHGTPSKPLNMADMKENAPKGKTSQMGDVTTVRPAKRKALQDVQWK